MTVVDKNSVLERSPDRPFRKYLKGVVIEPGLTLNETAAALYQGFDGQRSIEDICRTLVADYDVDLDTMTADAVGVAQELLEDKAIRLVGEAE